MDVTTPAVRRLVPHEPARWIWAVDGDGANAWACFRGRLRLERVPVSARAIIAVDSVYSLWVNGALVVREGGLKRGPTPVDAYADVVDLAPYLRPGANVVAVLTWYFGHDGASHRSSGRAALLVDIDADDRRLVSNGSWRARRHPAFGQRGEGPTVTLSERGIDFDARADTPGWMDPDHDDRGWPTAIELGASPAPPWGNLIERPIPPWRSSGRRTYDDQAAMALPRSGPCVVVGRLPANLQVLPWLSVAGAAGSEVQVQVERSKTSTRYVCRDGVQDFTVPAWSNGHHVSYTISAGVTLLDAGWHETGYDCSPSGRFACDVPWLETLWRKAVTTLRLCMRDTWMDCPDRERSQWIGDVANLVELAHVALDRRADALTSKCFRELVAWRTDAGILWSAIPTGRFRDTYREFPAQSLAGIAVGLRDHWLHGGDRDLLVEVYPVVRRYLLEVHHCDGDGRVIHRGPWETLWQPGTQSWYDWNGDQDRALLDQTWYALALRALVIFAQALGYDADAQQAAERISGLDRALQSWWNEDLGAYRSPDFVGQPDDRGNAVAVRAGLVPRRHHERVADFLALREASSIYMDRHALDALFQLGRGDQALARIQRRYAGALSSAYTTLPERFGEDSNHAWGCAPAAALIRELAGLAPIVPGWRHFRIAPADVVEPQRIEALVPSPLGDVVVTLAKTTSAWDLEVTVPDGAVAEVRLPERFTRIQVVGGVTADGPLTLGSGRWQVRALIQPQ